MAVAYLSNFLLISGVITSYSGRRSSDVFCSLYSFDKFLPECSELVNIKVCF